MLYGRPVVRMSVLACVLVGGCQNNTPPEPPPARPQVRVPDPVEPQRDPVPGWTVEVSGSGLLVGRLASVEENVFVAMEFEGEAAVGDTTFRSAGERDVAVLELDPKASVLSARSYGGTGDDMLQSLHGTLSSIRSFGGLSVGPTEVPAPSTTHDFLLPSVGVVIDVDTERVVHRVADSFQLDAWSRGDRAILVAAHFDDGESPTRTEVSMVRDGTPVWNTTLEGMQVSWFEATGNEAWLATKGQGRLETRQVFEGSLGSPHLTVRPGFEELGAIVRTAADGRAWGHTSAPRQGRLSHAARPFLATPSSFEPLLDATAFVLDADPATGDVLLNVVHATPINGEGSTVPTPGLFLLRAGTPKRVGEGNVTAGVLTPSHAVVLRSCGENTCIEAISR